MDDEAPVLITLTSRKVYIGYVIEVPDKPHDHYFTLALLLSGYRDSRTLEFNETQNYADKVENSEDLKRFPITLCMRDVVSAHPFDHDQYRNLFAPKRVLPRDVLGNYPVQLGGYVGFTDTGD